VVALVGVYLAVGVSGAYCESNSPNCGLYQVRVGLCCLCILSCRIHFCGCIVLQLVGYVVRSLIMLGIIVAMNFNITVRSRSHARVLCGGRATAAHEVRAWQHLRAGVFDGPWAPSLPHSYAQLTHFWSVARWWRLTHGVL